MRASRLFFSFLVFLFFLPGTGHAGFITKTGCGLGSGIYLDKLGTTNFWGTSMDVYNKNGTYYAYDWSNTSQCNSVNENSRVDSGVQCWVNTYVNPNNNNTGVQWGTIVTVSVNICDVPLDTHTWILLLVSSGAGYLVLRRHF